MTLAIFTLVDHKKKEGRYYGYGPYIREMNLWNTHADKVIVVSPISKTNEVLPIDLAYDHQDITHIEVPGFHVKSLPGLLRTLWHTPRMIYRIWKAMKQADHFHFRCPSNVSAVAAVVQILFPSKPKITKYAGNWDPESKQPRGYRFQKWLLAHTVMTRNMTVLVYGDWPGQSPCVRPFISATYHDHERLPIRTVNFNCTLRFAFVGAIVDGKRPLFTVKLIENLNRRGHDVVLDMFGDGDMMDAVRTYIKSRQLEERVILHGNQDKETVKTYFQKAQFTILPSKSEGWPKAVAEGMFFGAIPVSTRISCLEWMLGYGERGILIEPEIDKATETIEYHLRTSDLQQMSYAAQQWSQQYTIDELTREIEILMTR